MDNYIIRIYRRESRSQKLIRGIVEEAGKEERKLFSTFEELLEILFPHDTAEVEEVNE